VKIYFKNKIITSGVLPKIPDDFDQKVKQLANKVIEDCKNYEGDKINLLEFKNPYGTGQVIAHINLIFDTNPPKNLSPAYFTTHDIIKRSDGGYEGYVYIYAQYLYRIYLKQMSDAESSFKKFRETDKDRLGHLTVEYAVMTKMFEIISHELYHLFDPALIIPFLKYNKFHNYKKFDPKSVKKEEVSIEDIENWSIEETEILAQIAFGFNKLDEIIDRSLRNNFSHQVASEISNGILLLRNGDYETQYPRSLTNLPIHVLKILKNHGKIKELNKCVLKIYNHLLKALERIKQGI